MRKPHYWRFCSNGMTPKRIYVVDCETYFGETTLVGSTEYHRLRLGYVLTYHLDHGERKAIRGQVFRTPKEFWDFLLSNPVKKYTKYVIAHNAHYDMGVLDLWSIVLSNRCTIDKIYISDNIFYLKCVIDGQRFVFLDTCNYYHVSLEQIGRSVGIPKMVMPKLEDDDETWIRYCKNDVIITAQAFDNLLKFMRDNDLGRFAPTIAGCAFNSYLYRFMKHQVLVHSYKRPLEIERKAYYGGIVDTNFIGEVPCTEIYELDVCSMYPYFCTFSLPYKFVQYVRKPTPKRLSRYLEKYHVIAHVRICSEHNRYPVRCRDGVYYPVGTYDTYLAYPEFKQAFERGDILNVYDCCLYEHDKIFAEYMEYFVKRKIEYAEKGNKAFEQICKLFANSLYGKTGQLSHNWVVWSQEAFRILEYRYSLKEGTLKHYYDNPPDMYHDEIEIHIPEINALIPVRSLYGVIEIRVGESESRESVPAIAATVTSYARVFLRQIQEICGRSNWFYSDTDSIWTNKRGYENLCNHLMVKENTLGKLSLKRIHKRMIIHAPKDYETDSIIKLKGIRSDAKKLGDGTFVQLQFERSVQTIRHGVPGVVRVQHTTKRLKRSVNRCNVDSNGWTYPLYFPWEHPLAPSRVSSHDVKRQIDRIFD